MKNLYVLFCLISSFISYCQTIHETIGWINRNSQGRHKVVFIESTNKIQLIKVDIIPGVIESAKVQEFNASDVNMISAPTKNEDWNDLIFNFRRGGAEVTYFTIIDNNKKRSGESKKTVPGIVVDIKCDAEMILNYKKAYLNLFNKLKGNKIGVEIKDGDFYKSGTSTTSDNLNSNSDKLLNTYKVYNQELIKENEKLKKDNIELRAAIKEMTILLNRGAENIEKALESLKQKDLKISRMQDELTKKDSATLELVKVLKSKNN